MTTALLTLLLAQPSSADSLCQQFVRDNGVAGMSVTVLKEGKVAFEHAYGTIDKSGTVSATPKTLFRLASVSKATTAIAALKLVEEGKLDLDSDIRTYVPAWPAKDGVITLRHLFSHTSGIRHYAAGKVDNSSRHYWNCSDACELFRDDPLLFPVGKQVSYSTHAYTLIGAVLEKVSGKTFAEFLRGSVVGRYRSIQVEDLTRPLPTGWSEPFAKGPVFQAKREDNMWKAPGGGMIANSGDMARLFHDFTLGKLVKSATIDSVVAAIAPPATHFGGISEIGIQHAGAQQGSSAYVLGTRDGKFAITVLCNTSGVSAMSLAEKLSPLFR